MQAELLGRLSDGHDFAPLPKSDDATADAPAMSTGGVRGVLGCSFVGGRGDGLEWGVAGALYLYGLGEAVDVLLAAQRGDIAHHPVRNLAQVAV